MQRFLDYITEAEGNGLHVFDVDDTLFHTTAKVKVMRGNKHVASLSNSEYNTHTLPKGHHYDYTEFRDADVATTGELRAFTIVSLAAPGIPVPFVAGVIDCDGTSVRANVLNVPADPDHVQVGMKVRLVTAAIGTDAEGTEAIGFGFEPLEGASNGR